MRPIDKEEYGRWVKAASPPSPVGKDCCFAFLFDWGLPGIWFSYPVGLTCAGLLYSSRFFRRTRA